MLSHFLVLRGLCELQTRKELAAKYRIGQRVRWRSLEVAQMGGFLHTFEHLLTYGISHRFRTAVDSALVSSRYMRCHRRIAAGDAEESFAAVL